jgi:hypothetical protein
MNISILLIIRADMFNVGGWGKISHCFKDGCEFTVGRKAALVSKNTDFILPVFLIINV